MVQILRNRFGATFANIFAEDVVNAGLTTPAAMDVILMSNRYDAAPETNDFRTFVAHGIMPVTRRFPNGTRNL